MKHLVRAGSSGAVSMIAAIIAAPVCAAQVTVSGGFKAYAGPVWSYAYPGFAVSTQLEAPPDLPRAVPLQQPLADDPEDLYRNAGIGQGMLDVTYGGILPPVPEVQFWIAYDGSKEEVNAVAFTPAPTAEVGAGQEFRLGTFTLTNGGWFGTLPLSNGSTYKYPESAFLFSLRTHSADPALDGQVFNGTLRYIVTATDSSDPLLDADYFYILERTDLGYVGVYESYNTPTASNTGSIDLYGRIGSLVPTRFANADGAVLLPAVPVEPVPLPPTLALMLGALVTIGLRQARARAG